MLYLRVICWRTIDLDEPLAAPECEPVRCKPADRCLAHGINSFELRLRRLIECCCDAHPDNYLWIARTRNPTPEGKCATSIVPVSQFAHPVEQPTTWPKQVNLVVLRRPFPTEGEGTIDQARE